MACRPRSPAALGVGTAPQEVEASQAACPKAMLTVTLVGFVWGPGGRTNRKVISFQKLEPAVASIPYAPQLRVSYPSKPTMRCKYLTLKCV